MFPISANDPYIKSTGERSTMGQALGSGGESDIPAHTIADAGKVLTVDNTGGLEWSEVSGYSTFSRADATIPKVSKNTNAQEGN